MEKMAQGHGFGTEISRTGSISGSGCTRILQTQHGLFPDSNRGETGSFRIDHSFLVQYGGIHGFFQFRRCTRFFCRARVSRTAQSPYPSGSPLPSECVPPSRSTQTVLFACTRVDTCRPGDCMRSTSTHHLPLVRNLGIII
jgi:hypothetical protein